MRPHPIVPCLILVVLLILVPPWRGPLPAATTTQRDDLDCARLLTQRCETCHYLSRVCQQLGKKSRRRWRRTVRTMVRYGARLSKAEQRRLVGCLTDQRPEVRRLCAPPPTTEGPAAGRP